MYDWFIIAIIGVGECYNNLHINQIRGLLTAEISSVVAFKDLAPLWQPCAYQDRFQTNERAHDEHQMFDFPCDLSTLPTYQVFLSFHGPKKQLKKKKTSDLVFLWWGR